MRADRIDPVFRAFARIYGPSIRANRTYGRALRLLGGLEELDTPAARSRAITLEDFA